MDVREKLVDIIIDAYSQNPYVVADNLIANGVTIQKWIPVTERLPEYFGTFIVAVFENDPDNTMYTDSADFNPFEKEWRTFGYFAKGCEVTHWMPLPEPPKEGDPRE